MFKFCASKLFKLIKSNLLNEFLETYPAAWVETGVNQSCSTSTKDDQLKSPSTSNVRCGKLSTYDL